MPNPTIALQMEFAGVGGGWTDVWADVRASVPVVARYGIGGTGLRDRVASTGTLTFALDNSASNSGAVAGYYSPDHASKRSGWELGIRVRLKLTYSGTDYYKFFGTLETIQPTAGTKGERLVYCTVTDWMDEAAKHLLNLIAVQTDQRGDQLITTILANMTRQPVSTSLATGIDTFPYAGDNWRDERTTALAALQTIADSELGFVYVKGDTSNGGVLRFESRHTRLTSTTSLSTLSTDIAEMSSSRMRNKILNRVKVSAHPRTVDSAATTVLFTLRSQPAVGPGLSITITGQYSDPNQRGATRVGGTAMVAPVATTDYTMNTASDGSGSDLTASFTVSATYGGNSVLFTVTNNHATSTGYITKLQCRGKGVYDYEPTTYRTDDATSQTAYGLAIAEIDMPLQSSALVATDAGNFIISTWKDPATLIDTIAFMGNRNATALTAALAREPGDRVTVTETLTGINRDFVINGVEITLTAPSFIRASWTVAPSALVAYWIIGVSELGTTTRLGY